MGVNNGDGQPGGPASKALERFRSEIGIDEKATWVPYTGPEGGEGWQNIDTGDIEYTDDPPGETPDPDDIPDEDLEQLADEAGVEGADADEIRDALKEELDERGGGDGGDGGDSSPGGRGTAPDDLAEDVSGLSDSQAEELYEEVTDSAAPPGAVEAGALRDDLFDVADTEDIEAGLEDLGFADDGGDGGDGGVELADPDDGPAGGGEVGDRHADAGETAASTGEAIGLASGVSDEDENRVVNTLDAMDDPSDQDVANVLDEAGVYDDVAGEVYGDILADKGIDLPEPDTGGGGSGDGGGGDGGGGGETEPGDDYDPLVDMDDEDAIKEQIDNVMAGADPQTVDEVAFQLSRADEPTESDVEEAAELAGFRGPDKDRTVDQLTAELGLPYDDDSDAGGGADGGGGDGGGGTDIPEYAQEQEEVEDYYDDGSGGDGGGEDFSTTDPAAGQAAFEAIDDLGGPGDNTKDMAKDAIMGIGESGDPLTEENIMESLSGLTMSPRDKEQVVEAVRDEASGGVDQNAGFPEDTPEGQSHKARTFIERRRNGGDEGNAGRAGVSEKAGGADLGPAARFKLLVSAKNWVPYEGPMGGEGWQNIESGEVSYDDEPPGAAPDPDKIPDEDLEAFAEDNGIDAEPEELRDTLREELADRGAPDSGGGDFGADDTQDPTDLLEDNLPTGGGMDMDGLRSTDDAAQEAADIHNDFVLDNIDKDEYEERAREWAEEHGMADDADGGADDAGSSGDTAEVGSHHLVTNPMTGDRMDAEVTGEPTVPRGSESDEEQYPVEFENGDSGYVPRDEVEPQEPDTEDVNAVADAVMDEVLGNEGLIDYGTISEVASSDLTDVEATPELVNEVAEVFDVEQNAETQDPVEGQVEKARSFIESRRGD